jgi:anti-anti-sigma factor
MTERPWLVRTHLDLAEDPVGSAPTPTTRSARRTAGIYDTMTVPLREPSFTVARHTQPTAPSASISADRMVVVPAGYVDMGTAPVLRSTLVKAVDSHPEVCCDLTHVDFFSAAGVRVLLATRQRAMRAGSRFWIRGAHGITRRLLQITDLERLLVEPGHDLGQTNRRHQAGPRARTSDTIRRCE